MNRKVKTHIRYEWWGYLLIVILAFAVWIPAFNAATKPKRNETISISFIGQGVDARALQKELYKTMPSLTEQNIKSINVSSADINNFYKEQTLFSIAEQADLIIFTEKNIKDEIISFYFDAVKNSSVLDSYAGGAEYYRIDGAIFGVKVGGEGMENNFMSYYGGTETCYCFFGYKSENLKKLNGAGSEYDDAALKTLEWLLKKG